ncbi:hypothetical protein [Clostridium sp.]|uniref:hypothetical protein n=1 Tax=Clostridium sp. TaxID=1506 RepID=UPI002FC8315A
MIIELKDKKMEESLKHLRKAIEIVGGCDYLEKIDNDSDLIEEILRYVFYKGEATICIDARNYTVMELCTLKTEFEKYFLKNKLKVINRIVSKIKEYNTQLESKIRKFKKSNSIDEFKVIVQEIEDRYKWEFDNFLLNYIDNMDEDKNYYGEYLKEKRKQMIDSILKKLGI